MQPPTSPKVDALHDSLAPAGTSNLDTRGYSAEPAASSLPVDGATHLFANQASQTQANATQRATNDLWAHLKKQFELQQIPWDDHFRVAHPFLSIKEDAPPDAIRSLNNLLIAPLAVTDNELSQIFKTRLVPLDDPKDCTRIERQQFYVRRIHVTANQLLAIVLDWQERGLFYQEASAWFQYAEQALDSPLTLSYVGTVGRGRTPATRFKEDEKRANGVMAAFRDTVLKLFPGVWDACTVLELVDAAVPSSVSQKKIDQRERLLIHLFGFSTLLNRQGGGFLPVHEFTEKDTKPISQLGLKTFARFQDQTPLEARSIHTLEEWHDARMQWAEENAELTRTSSYPASVLYNNMMLRQATPKMYKGHVLTANFGKEITFEEYLHASPSPFFFGPSRAAQIVQICMAALQAAEQTTALPFGSSDMPFVDLIPWLGRTPCIEMAYQLGDYLQVTKPFVVSTMSQVTSSFTAANFRHQHGLPKTNFLSMVGVPRLAYWDYSGWDDALDTPPPSSLFIQIPHIHPGRDKYGSQPPCLRTVYLITWGVTHLLIQNTMDLLDEDQMDPQDRASFCAEILRRFERHSGPLMLALKQAKEELAQVWQSQNHARLPVTETTKLLLSQASADRVIQAGFAVGPPESEARRVQVDGLWKLNMPDLHLVHPRTPAGKNDWYKWAMSRPENLSFRMSLMAKRGDMARLKPFIGEDEDPEDPVIQRQALQRLGGFLKAALEDAGTTTQWSSQYQRARIASRWGSNVYSKPAKNLEGSKVHIFSNHKFRIYWINADDQELGIPGTAPKGSRPQKGESLRRLTFVPEGVSLINDNGDPLLFSINSQKQQVTWTCQQIDRLKNADMWRQMWTAHTQLAWPVHILAPISSTLQRPLSAFFGTPVVRPPTDILPATFFEPSGEDPSSNATAPLKPGDSLWLFKQFLDEYSPRGGSFFVNDHIDQFPDESYRNISVQLGEFLERPRYRHHPHLNTWKAFLTPHDQHGKRAIYRNLQALRLDVQRRKQKHGYHPITRKKVSGRIWHFGVSRPEL